MIEYAAEVHDPLFNRFSSSDVKILLPLFEQVILDAGDVLFSFDQPGTKLYFVVHGQLAVQKRTGFGDRTQVVALLDPGAPVGERALMRDNVHCSRLVAVKKTLLLSLSRERFAQFKKEHSLLAMNLLEWLLNSSSLRLSKSSDRLSHVL